MAHWILLRGLVRESRHWGGFVAQFQEAFPDEAVTALDLAGNGHRRDVPSPLSVRGMVEDCRAQLRARSIAPPYKLLAISMGGMVAVRWAHEYPNELECVVALNTSMRPFNRLWQRLRPKNYGTFLRLVLWPWSAWHTERAILRMTSAHRNEAELARWVALRQSAPVSRWNALRQLFAAARFSAPLSAPQVQMLLLASTDDQLVSAECSRNIARSWQVPLLERAGAGHDLPLDDAAWVIHTVKQWQG